MNRGMCTWDNLTKKERMYLETVWRSFRKGGKRITLGDYHNKISEIYLGYVHEGLMELR